MPDDPRLGRTIAGAYTPFQVLGAGGSATVYRAVQHSLGREVALKLLRPETVSTDPAAVDLFLQEGAIVSGLDHPNIVAVFDVGRTEDGALFLVMERLYGRTLRDVVHTDAPLGLERAVALATQICDALDAAHQRRVVHCDLKPDNVFVLQGAGRLGDFVKLIDFGIARVLDAPGRRPTDVPGFVVGSPRYLAPERIRHRPIDGRCDQYALGCILFELLAGRPPIAGGTPLETLRAQLHEEPPRVSTFRDDVPAALDALVARTLAKDPDQRFANVAELREALVAAAPAADLAARRRLRLGANLLRTNLPVEADRFVGREEEMRVLAATLDGGQRLLTLTGPGGMGKSRLARRLALGWLVRSATARRTVACADLSAALTVEMVCVELARVLGGAREIGDRDVVRVVGRALAERGESILLLDGLDHLVGLLDDAVATWLRAAPELRLLVTSRQRLALPGEHVYEVGPLSLPCGAGDAGASDAVRLFFERAAETNPSLPRDEATAAVVAELVRRLDGMPLAIELAAARSSILSPAQILAKLDNRFRLLAGPPGRGGGPGALRRTIEWSFSLLEPHEQATLAQISVFRGGFAPEAVAGVVDLSAFGPGADPLESLAALRDKSLVRARETDDPTVPRYDLYESIRELAAAELARDDGTAGAVRRHAEYYLLVGALWADDIRDRDDAEARACLEREVDNLLAVHAYAIAREPRVAANVETGLRALLAVDPVLSTRGLVDAHGGWLDAGLAAARGLAVAPTLLAAVSTARAALLVRNGRFELATDAFDESLRLALAAGDRVQEARCLMGLALCWASRRDPDRALRLLQAARAPADEVGAPTMLGELDKMTGLAHYAAGDYELAARFFRVGAARAEAAGFSLERAVALHNLGDASARLGHWNDALAALAGSQAIVEKNGLARLGEFNELLLGCVEAQTSKNAAAVARVERVLDAARALGNHWMAVQVAFFLGRAHAALGHDGRARAYLLESLDLARRDDNGAYVRDAEAALRDLDHLPP